VHAPGDDGLILDLEKLVGLVTEQAQLKMGLETVGRVLVTKRSEYQRQRERAPDAPSALDSFRAGLERTEKEYKSMEKVFQERADRHRQEWGELISHLRIVPQSETQGPTIEGLIARIKTLESQVESKTQQWEDRVAAQKLSFDKKGESLASSQQAFEKKVEERLESQCTESLRQELDQLGKDRTSMKADIAKLEKALQENQKLVAKLQTAAADPKRAVDAQKALADSKKAMSDSQKAISEGQILKQQLDNTLEPLKHDIKRLASGLSAAEKHLDELDSQHNKLPDYLAELRQALSSEHEVRLQKLSSQVQEQGRRLNELEPEQVDKIFWDYDVLKKSNEELHQGYAQINSRLAALEAPESVQRVNGRGPGELPSAADDNNSKALEVANEAKKGLNATSQRMEQILQFVKDINERTVRTSGGMIDGCEKRITALETRLAGQKTPSDLTQMQEKLEQVSVKQEELSSTLTETAGNTANLSARMEAQDQMHRNLQSQYQNLQTRDLHDAIVGYVSRSYQDEFAEIRKDQAIIKRDQAEIKKDMAEIKAGLLGLQGDGRDPKRRRIDVDVSLGANGSY
jgi:chromosome segregation ATPase